ncbi:MAG: hypothetical protein ACR2FN_03170 [Chitinophagaceae bacterium]
MNERKPKKNNQLLLQYAGLGSQLLVSLGIATYVGYEGDKWIKTNFPLFIWLLPLLVLIFMMIKIIRDTSKKQDG